MGLGRMRASRQQLPSEGCQHCGMDIINDGRANWIFGAFGVGLADDQAAPDSASSQRQAESGWPMVPASCEIHLWRPAELAAA